MLHTLGGIRLLPVARLDLGGASPLTIFGLLEVFHCPVVYGWNLLAELEVFLDGTHVASFVPEVSTRQALASRAQQGDGPGSCPAPGTADL